MNVPPWHVSLKVTVMFHYIHFFAIKGKAVQKRVTLFDYQGGYIMNNKTLFLIEPKFSLLISPWRISTFLAYGILHSVCTVSVFRPYSNDRN